MANEGEGKSEAWENNIVNFEDEVFKTCRTVGGLMGCKGVCG